MAWNFTSMKNHHLMASDLILQFVNFYFLFDQILSEPFKLGLLTKLTRTTFRCEDIHSYH